MSKYKVKQYNIHSVTVQTQILQCHNMYFKFTFSKDATNTDKHEYLLSRCKHWWQSLWISSPWTEFSKSLDFSDLKRCLHVYGRPQHRELVCFKKYLCTHPHTHTNIQHICSSYGHFRLSPKASCFPSSPMLKSPALQQYITVLVNSLVKNSFGF